MKPYSIVLVRYRDCRGRKGKIGKKGERFKKRGWNLVDMFDFVDQKTVALVYANVRSGGLMLISYMKFYFFLTTLRY